MAAEFARTAFIQYKQLLFDVNFLEYNTFYGITRH